MRADTAASEQTPLVEVECTVVDVESVTALPPHAQKLGEIAVPVTGTGEQAVRALNARVCALGGNALTRVSIVKDVGDDEEKLEGTAWRVPGGTLATQEDVLRHGE